MGGTVGALFSEVHYLAQVAQDGVHLNTHEMGGHMNQASRILIQGGHRQLTGNKDTHIMGQAALAQTIQTTSMEEAKGAPVVFMVDGGGWSRKKVIFQRASFWKLGLKFKQREVGETTSQTRQNNLRAEELICKSTRGAFRDIFVGHRGEDWRL